MLIQEFAKEKDHQRKMKNNESSYSFPSSDATEELIKFTLILIDKYMKNFLTIFAKEFS